jgi:predicted kinase
MRRVIHTQCAGFTHVGNDQQVDRDGFDLFYYSIRKRMFLWRLTVAEKTALHPDARRTLLREMACMQGHLACPLIFNVSAVTCLEREEKPEHSVGEEGVAWHALLLQQPLLDAPQEAWITSMSEAKPTWMHTLKSHCNQVLEDLKIGLVCVF